MDGQLVDVDFPSVGALGGVGRHTVGQGHRDAGVGELDIVQAHILGSEVDAVTLEAQLPDGSLHTGGINEVDGVDLGLLERQLVDLDSLLQQRPKTHARHHMLDVGNGVALSERRVVLLNDLHVVDTQVQGELQANMSDADLHPCLLGGIRSNLLHCPILKRREVKQCRKQHHKAYQDARGPCSIFKNLLHLSEAKETFGYVHEVQSKQKKRKLRNLQANIL